MMIAQIVYDVPAVIILNSCVRAITAWDLITSMIKAWVFGAVISIVGSFFDHTLPNVRLTSPHVEGCACHVSSCHQSSAQAGCPGSARAAFAGVCVQRSWPCINFVGLGQSSTFQVQARDDIIALTTVSIHLLSVCMFSVFLCIVVNMHMQIPSR